VNAHEGITPGKKQEEKQALMRRTYKIVDVKVGEYMKAHDKGDQWATPVRAYYEALIDGRQLSGHIKLDTDTKQLVRQWVREAQEETGHTPPKRATKPKRKPRRKS
jgi:hypothetical protein